VNRAIDHVLTHLHEPLRLEDVAAVAAFSPFHFHRVFKALTGETLARFVKRRRLERALGLMAAQPDAPMSRVALDSGFASASDFSRSFRNRYGVPPSAFDLDRHRDAGRARMVEELDQPDLARLPPGANPDGFEVTLRDLPARTVAYLRVHRPYEGDGVVQAAKGLERWAEARGFADGQWLGYQWDGPDLVPLDKCRYDVGVEVPDTFEAEGEVGRLALPAMTIAELDLDGPIDLEMRALDWLFGTWLPMSAYVPDAQPAFEAWHGRPFADGMTRFRLRVQLPVTRPAG